MIAVAAVLLIGTLLEGLNPAPANIDQFNAQVLAKLNAPVIVADYSNLNR